MCGAAAMMVKLEFITLSQVEVVEATGLNGFCPQIALIPVDSKALVVLVRAAKSIKDALRSHRGPVTPAGQANSTGAGKSSTFNCLTVDPFAGTASMMILD